MGNSKSVDMKSDKLIRYAITLEYNGSAFAGFQIQPNGYTVQQALEESIEKQFGYKGGIAAASRTDAGVHAKGQVAIFDMLKVLKPERITGALNCSLPKSVRIIKTQIVASDWHPRYESLHKTYVYLINDREVQSPFWEGRAYQVKHRLNVDKMRKAAAHLLGKQDFSSFRASGCGAKDAVRELQKIIISRAGSMITFRFQGNAFLYHMVRNLVGTLVNVGIGKLLPDDVKKIIKAKNRKIAGPTAPACGLYLEKIVFGRTPRMGTNTTGRTEKRQ